MKFASNVIALALASGAVVNGMSIRGNTKHANKLIASARRLEEQEASADNEEQEASADNEQQSADAEEEEFSLADYSITLLSCNQGEEVMADEDGEESESSSVVFRLCPSSSCNMTDSLIGCDDGYGDYVVGIDTFLEVYKETLREEENREENEEENEQQNNNPMVKYNAWGQEFDASQYMECSAFEQEQEQQQNYYYKDVQFYIAPSCSADGKSIVLAAYFDEDCTDSFTGNFTDVSAGWDILPFSDGLVSMDCVSCGTANEDGNMEVNEMCERQFESSVAQCDTTTSTGCDFVDSLMFQTYGNLTQVNTSDRVKEAISNAKDAAQDAVSKASTKFMDTMNTQEARAFIAAMVVFALSFFAGITFISCLVVKKQRKRRQQKQSTQVLLSGSDDEDETVKKRRSSVVSLVRTGTNQLKETVTAAFEKKEEEEDKTVNSEYKAPEFVDEPKSPRARGSRFVAKMDKHMKKLSQKFPLSPKSKK